MSVYLGPVPRTHSANLSSALPITDRKAASSRRRSSSAKRCFYNTCRSLMLVLASRPYESRFDQPYATNVKDVEACQTVGGPICLGSPFVFNDDKASSVGAQQHRGWPCRKRRTLLHRVRSRCTRAVALRSLMIGTIVTVLLLIYAWNVDNLWMSEFARVGSGLGHWDPSSGRTGSSGEVAEVRRRWLHSHNDEMRGKDALVSAPRPSFAMTGRPLMGRRWRSTSVSARSRLIRGLARHRHPHRPRSRPPVNEAC